MNIHQVIVDGYNLLHRVPRLRRLLRSDADAARRSLVELLRRTVHARATLVVVFDGNGEGIPSRRDARVEFSGTRTADAAIRLLVERSRDPRAVAVVSSDSEVVAHARACGAVVYDADALLNQRGGAGGAVEPMRGSTAADEKPATSPGKREIEQWLSLFGAEGTRVEDDPLG